MAVSRREFLKLAGSSAVAAAGTALLLPGLTLGDAQAQDVTWDKAPCRFCGTGCGVLVGTSGGKITAIKGDPASPVNRGLLCVKGYNLLKIHTARDRLTVPLLRVGPKSTEGKATFRRISWDQALDLMASKVKAAQTSAGEASVAMFGSGQWTIWEGYAAVKLYKGGLRSHNIEPNARHCMASAVAAFMNTFGIDEPAGNYEDFEHADAFVLWGANMAEMHPMLWGRVVDRKLSSPGAKIINLTTISNRCSEMADEEIIFKPQSDLAIANGIARIILQRGAQNTEFIEKYAAIRSGKTNIGYGVQDKFAFDDEAKPATLEEYGKLVAEYTPERVQEISGVSPDALERLASVYSDPKIKVMSLWTMGVNQHTRGTWMNNLIYNLHLLTGKISEPGNSPLSLTGQPSACGTCREVGTFSHRLPADMVVANPEHRKITEEIWGLPPGTIPEKPGYHAVELFRAMDRGEIKFMWVQVSNPFQDFPNLTRYRKAATRDDCFVVVSDIYPTRSTELADLILPSATWVEKEGAFGNTERRTQFWRKMIDAPGEAKSDLWQTVELAKRLGHEKLFSYDKSKYPIPPGHPASDTSQTAGFYLEKALFEEYRRFGLGKAHDLAPFDVYHQNNGLIWPVVNGKETKWRFREGNDPYVKAGQGIRFYGNEKLDGKAVIWLRPYEPAAETPDSSYPMWLCTGRVLEHWHSGTMTRRIPDLLKAYPYATANLHPEDAKLYGISAGDRVRISSRRGSVEVYVEIGGRVTPQKGMVYVPWFDEDVMINFVTLDAFCPISKQTDFKKCAVKLEKV